MPRSLRSSTRTALELTHQPANWQGCKSVWTRNSLQRGKQLKHWLNPSGGFVRHKWLHRTIVISLLTNQHANSSEKPSSDTSFRTTHKTSVSTSFTTWSSFQPLTSVHNRKVTLKLPEYMTTIRLIALLLGASGNTFLWQINTRAWAGSTTAIKLIEVLRRAQLRQPKKKKHETWPPLTRQKAKYPFNVIR